MGNIMKVIGKMEKEKAEVYFILLMEEDMMVIGLLIENMVKVKSLQNHRLLHR